MADPQSRAGVRYASPQLIEYLTRVHAGHDEALTRAFSAPEQHGLPAIQIGPLEGRLLEMLCRLAGCRRVVEIGTLAAYSTIWLARALAADGHLWTLEASDKHASVARANLRAAGLEERVTVVTGLALERLPELERHGPFDAVFIDADKESYDAYGRWAARNLRSGGLLLADNAFFFGGLLDDNPVAATMRRFHEEAARACRTVCIPTSDGLLVGVKL